MSMRTRPGINKTLRSQILKRDGQACRKCGRHDILDIHHIQAVMDGGSDDHDNLITFCRRCHREWELAEMSLDIDFDTWLPLPPYAMLVTTFISLKDWKDEVEVNVVYDAAMQGHQMISDIRRLEAIDQYQERKATRKKNGYRGDSNLTWPAIVP